ncbi:MAG: protein kinase [Gemmataceae bacterium]|nr:protein kinase [Gemmataceae bacterium]
MTNSANNDENVPLEVLRRIHQTCERFESAWHGGDRPVIGDYLVAVTDPERSALLAELLAIDLEMRVAAHELPDERDYRSHFADANDGKIIERVFSEYRSCRELPPLPTVSIHLNGGRAEASPGTVNTPSIAGYEILDVLGRGGMGVVYKARDLRLKRLVALKMILAGEHAGPHLLSRFRREAELAARLQHPNIVQVFDVGEQGGRPFIAFEYIEGRNLADYVNREPQPARLAAELLEAMASAIHYAHQQGIVHRDLKPPNILLANAPQASGAGSTAEIHNRREPSSGVGSSTPSRHTTASGLIPKITDFGLAKDVEDAGEFSSTGAILGTPNYMSPEQAEGRVREIGPATDIYSLGAILYVLITGRPPFQGTTPIETISLVTRDEPVAPTELQPRLPRDLETICLKCLHKDPARRYSSAGELADDLCRFLNDETILARPSSWAEKTWRMCRRNPLVAGLTAAVFLVLVAGIGVSANFAILAQTEAEAAQSQKQRAETIAQRARERAYLSDVRQIQYAWDDIDLGTVNDLLEAQHPDRTDGVDLRRFEWHYWNRLAQFSTLIGRHAAGVKCVCCSPDGKLIASAGGDAVVRIWDVDQAVDHKVLTGHTGPVNCVCFSPDGKQLVSAGNDHSVRIWSPSTGTELHQLAGHQGPVNSVVYSRDGKWIVSASGDKSIKVWDTATGNVRLSILVPSKAPDFVSISPDGKWAVSGALNDKPVSIWDLETGRESNRLDGHPRGAVSASFSPDGRSLITGSHDPATRIWEFNSGILLRELKGHRWQVLSVCFNGDGTQLATANFDKTIKLWQADTGRELQTLKGHRRAVSSVVFHPDGRRLVSGSDDHTVRVWEMADIGARGIFNQHLSQVYSLACSRDGRWLASTGGILDEHNHRLNSGELFLWDRKKPGKPRQLPGHISGVTSAKFTPDGRTLISTGGHWDNAKQQFCGGDVRLWDPVTGRQLASLNGHSVRVLSLAVSPDGKLIATGGVDGDVLVRRLPDGADSYAMPGLGKEITALAFSPDGRHLAVGGFDQTVRIWDLSTRRQIAVLPVTSKVSSIAFRPDGKQLAVSDYYIEIHLFNTADFQLERRLQGHTGGVDFVTYSPDGHRLAAGGEDTTVRIWDTTSGQELLTLRGHTDVVKSVTFSPDGQVLFSGSWDRTIRIWDARPR